MTSTGDAGLTSGQLASLACLLEATAHKPGNVHRGADFAEMSYPDMLASAIAIGAALDTAASSGVGAATLQAIRLTRATVGKNTNLGTVLLLAPLAAAAAGHGFPASIATVLGGLTGDDARDVYSAIRLAQPGGLGQAEESDVYDEPPADLLNAMRAAKDRDLVACQYVNGFHEVIHVVLPAIERTWARRGKLLDAIVAAHVETMAAYPDSLIARKCGLLVAQEAAVRAQRTMDAGEYGDDAYHAELAELDFWLRADGHRRNPGTTADLVAAAVFVGLRDGRFPVSMQ